MIIVQGFQFLWAIDRHENVKVVFGFALLRTVSGLENLRLFQPIRCKTKTNHDLVACVFPRFRLLTFVFFLWVLIGSS